MLRGSGGAAGREAADRHLKMAWVLDSPLGPTSPDAHGTSKVLEVLAGLPADLWSREQMVALLLGAGLPKHLVAWISTSLRPADGSGHLQLGFDVCCARELFASYCTEDLTSVLAEGEARVHCVRAERAAWDDAAWEAVVNSEGRASGSSRRVSSHILRGAGHWLHTDNPDGLIAILGPHFREASSESAGTDIDISLQKARHARGDRGRNPWPGPGGGGAALV